MKRWIREKIHTTWQISRLSACTCSLCCSLFPVRSLIGCCGWIVDCIGMRNSHWFITVLCIYDTPKMYHQPSSWAGESILKHSLRKKLLSLSCSGSISRLVPVLKMKNFSFRVMIKYTLFCFVSARQSRCYGILQVFYYMIRFRASEA